MTTLTRGPLAIDDDQNVALQVADWSVLAERADITLVNDHVSDPDELVARLAPFDVVSVMREPTPRPRSIIERLPKLRMIAPTGRVQGAGRHGRR